MFRFRKTYTEAESCSRVCYLPCLELLQAGPKVNMHHLPVHISWALFFELDMFAASNPELYVHLGFGEAIDLCGDCWPRAQGTPREVGGQETFFRL